MWFVFPQLQGLGSSPMAQLYALGDLDEARAFLAHPILGERLRTCTELVLQSGSLRIDAVFGHPDDRKFHSSMTLFAEAAPATAPFGRALAQFFEGRPDKATLHLLAGQPRSTADP